MIHDSEMQHLFDAAVGFLEEGDLRTASRFFKAYLAGGGKHEASARDYLRRVGDEAFAVGRTYQKLRRFQHAKEHFKLAVALGGETGKSASETLRALPPSSTPKFDEFKSAISAPSVKPARFWRRPHMDLSKSLPLSPGDSLRVRVWADESNPQPGEESDPIELPDNSESFYDLEVRLLVSEHFRIEGPSTQLFRIERCNTSTETVEFSVQTKDAVTLQKLGIRPTSLCAEFLFRNRPSGKVLRRPEIVGVVTPPLPEPPKELPLRHDSVSVDASAKNADLLIIVTSQVENDNRHFWCTVQTDLLPEYTKGVTKEWVTAEVTNSIVAGYMQDFTKSGLSKIERLTKLRGAGKELFKASPLIFHKVFWSLIDSNVKPTNVAVVSDEPFIPWELMIPYRDSNAGVPPEVREPLGVEFRIGRMCRRSHIAGTQRIPLTKSYVVAPVFDGPNSLPHAQKEADFVTSVFPGDRIEPATFSSLNTELRQCRSLLHFACHGEVTEEGKQVLYLDNEDEFSALDLCGLPGAETGIPTARPLVFLNACQVGRPVPSLIGVGGFTATFTEMGACAVIAPLWSVKDTIAHEIAVAFYRQVNTDKSVPLAEILRRQRAKAYDPDIAEDTYAAYCFYGDPLAVAV